VTGTPTFFINGERLVGEQPLEVLERAVEDAARGRPKMVEAGYFASLQPVLDVASTGLLICGLLVQPDAQPSYSVRSDGSGDPNHPERTQTSTG
jgi:hypothetical protein